MKFFRDWSHISWVTINKTYAKKFKSKSKSIYEKEKKKKNIGNCKVFFVLHANLKKGKKDGTNQGLKVCDSNSKQSDFEVNL